MTEQKVKILIGMPTPSVVQSETADCLELIKQDCIPRGIDLVVMRTEGVYVFKQRNLLAQKAIELGCTHIFMLDNDMITPAHIISRFVNHDKDIITTNYVIKMKRGKCRFACTDENFKTIPLTENSVGIQKVHVAPTGTMLIKTSVFQKMTDYFWNNKLDYPWFFHSVIHHEGVTDQFGEDSHFTHFANKAGIDVYVDNDLSKQVEHIGWKAYNWRDAV